MGEAKLKEWAEREQRAAAEAQRTAAPGIRLPDQSVLPPADGSLPPGSDPGRTARVEILPDGSAVRMVFPGGGELAGAPEELVSHAEMILQAALRCFAQRNLHFQAIQRHLLGGAGGGGP